MRWNRRERAVGQWAAFAVLLCGWVVVGRPGAATRIEPGMTPSAVAGALGSPGGTHPTKFSGASYCLIRPPRNEAEFQRFLAGQREFYRTNSQVYQQYRLPFETVEVDFRGVKGEEQVRSVVSYPSLGWIDWNWPLAGWACAAAFVGLAATEHARQERPAAPTGAGEALPAGAAPDA